MILDRLLAALTRRFGLRARRLPCARRNRAPYGPHAPFAVVMRDGLPMIEPRAR